MAQQLQTLLLSKRTRVQFPMSGKLSVTPAPKGSCYLPLAFVDIHTIHTFTHKKQSLAIKYVAHEGLEDGLAGKAFALQAGSPYLIPKAHLKCCVW